MSIDGFTDFMKKMGYAWVRVQLDAGKPLKPVILIRGKKRIFWQQFVYENLPQVYYQCGRLGHFNGCCRFLEGELASGGADFSLQPDNAVIVGGEVELEIPVPMVAEGKGDGEGGRPKLGPWLVTSRICQPRISRASTKRRRDVKEKGAGPSSSDPYSSSPPMTSPTATTSSPNSSPDFDGW